ncbi:MAG: HAMP domain-containing histidine kinase [Chloroflexi bacterium]|nr:HAMP domain-containing histidine kinase [Chloroflexota bacterium]
MALSESEQTLRAWRPTIEAFAASAVALAIGVFDTTGRAQYLNPGMTYLLGGEDDAANLAARLALPAFDDLQRGSGPGAVYRGLLTFGGGALPYRSVRGEVHRADNRLLLIAEHDVQELDRVNHELMHVNQEITNLQRELARHRAELVQLNELKNEFMGIAAHDLRSPLSVIQGFASLLTRRPDMPPEERTELLELISESVQDMLGMLSNLLNISEIEAGKLRLRPAPVNVYEYMDRIVRLNRPLAEQKEIALVLDLPPGLPPTVYDPDRIQQVLNNLLSNAFKFSHPGTAVTLRVMQTPGGALEFSVIDQGQGIKPDELDKLFKPFQRTSTRSTAGEHSSGLGLAICKRIVELSGGRIGVESEYGTGSRFYFVLPVPDAPG